MLPHNTTHYSGARCRLG